MYLHKFDTQAHLVTAISAAYTAFTAAAGITSVLHSNVVAEPVETQFRSSESLPLLLRGIVASKVKSTPVANGLMRNTALIKIPTTYTDPVTSTPNSKWATQVKIEFTTSNNSTATEIERIFAATVSVVINPAFLTAVLNGMPIAQGS